MKILNIASSLFLAMLALAVGIESIRLGVGSPRNPGMGFVPLLVASLFLTLSVAILSSNAAGKNITRDREGLPTPQKLKKPTVLMIALFSYVFLLNILGFLTATFLLFFTMLFMYEPKKWCTHVCFGAIAAVLSWLVFCRGLQVPLPIGVLGF